MAVILLIEDSSYMRSVIRSFLSPDGHELLEAETGYQGLQMIHELSPDCLILDLIIPDMDGLKVLKALRDLGSNIPVIVVTADIQESVRKQCMELGAKAFVNKPPKKEPLRNTVKTVLGIKTETT